MDDFGLLVKANRMFNCRQLVECIDEEGVIDMERLDQSKFMDQKSQLKIRLDTDGNDCNRSVIERVNKSRLDVSQIRGGTGTGTGTGA
mmetsp:Transcript_66335/g.143133  ORF Transcript_66335/g.143133 Transcript_66335/m.143133 type:complete len:88 (+) Transcript_66335:907-1170(+)